MQRRTFLAWAPSVFTPCVLWGRESEPTRPSPPTAGPLAVHPGNARYFRDARGETVWLRGSHLGWELQDDAWDRSLRFDYDAYLDLFAEYDLNLIRLWCVEHTRSSHDEARAIASPMPFARTGAERALDGRPKFDLTQFSSRYFDRLRRRVVAARQRGVYVLVMLFQGWSLRGDEKSSPWFGHYLHPANNVHGWKVAPESIHTLAHAEVTRVQEAYVRRVTEAVGDLDNVLYEISNESLGSLDWHERMIAFLRRCPAERRMPHPIVLSGCRRGLRNPALFASQADAVGVSRDDGDAYFDDPPPADGKKIVLVDSDHVKPDTNDPGFVWRNLFRGNHALVLDWGLVPGSRYAEKNWHPVRNAMCRAAALAERVDLAQFVPQGDRSSTGYCLAGSDGALLAYLPQGERARIDGLDSRRGYRVRWYDPAGGEWQDGGPCRGETRIEVTPPAVAPAVVYLCPVANS